METTCKRISHKLLRNVVKFFDIIVNHDMGSEGFRVIQHTHTNEFMEPNENELNLAESLPKTVKENILRVSH